MRSEISTGAEDVARERYRIVSSAAVKWNIEMRIRAQPPTVIAESRQYSAIGGSKNDLRDDDARRKGFLRVETGERTTLSFATRKKI